MASYDIDFLHANIFQILLKLLYMEPKALSTQNFSFFNKNQKFMFIKEKKEMKMT